MPFQNGPTSAASPASHTSTHQLIHDQIVCWLREHASFKVDQIDFDESLFELGVDSLGAATIACELERQTNKTLNPEVVYELETIDALADYLDSLPVSTAGTAVPNPADGITAKSTDLADRAFCSNGQSDTPNLLSHYERLNRRVRALKEQGQYYFEPEIAAHDGAWVVVDQQRMLMFGSYEYLGLLGHPQLNAAAIQALEDFGTGQHGARLLAGTTTAHKKLEAKLASFMAAEDAIVFSSGYVTNLATISTLVGRGDVVIGDEWNHASIVDGCRLSGAKFVEFRHNDMDSLAEVLHQNNGAKMLVVVDAVFSMEGDVVDMVGVVDLCKKHGALLMVDEAHSLGVLGKTGHGVQEQFGLDPHDIDVKMGTLSKTFGNSGGFVAGREEIITYLRHHARGYIFSGALPTPQVCGAIAAVEIVDANPHLVSNLWDNVRHYLDGLHALGFNTGKCTTPIVPVMTEDNGTTLEMTRICRSEGLLVVPVCFPAVPIDAPRLRTCVSAIHETSDIDFALDVLGRAARKTGLIA